MNLPHFVMRGIPLNGAASENVRTWADMTAERERLALLESALDVSASFQLSSLFASLRSLLPSFLHTFFIISPPLLRFPQIAFSIAVSPDCLTTLTHLRQDPEVDECILLHPNSAAC